MTSKCSAVVIGVGPQQGLGATLAAYFAAKGLHVFIAGRSPDKINAVAETIINSGNLATPVMADATLEDDVIHLFEVASLKQRRISIAAYNVDSNIPAPLLETGVESYEKLWRQNCLGAFLFGREAINSMKKFQQGTIIFTGATASLRARPPFTAFASTKAGLRALAQGMAREFGPLGIHVVHAILDGVLDGERARKQFPDFVKNKGQDGLMQLEAIAQTYWALHNQPASAWTHELDLRPYKEPF